MFGKLKDKKNRKKSKITKLQNQLKKMWEVLTLSEFYELRANISDKSLLEKIEQEILEMATGEDDLWDIIRNEEGHLREKAWKKLCRRIENGEIRKKNTWETLLKIIKEIPELRIEAWSLLKTLNPPAEELQRILDFEFIYSMPSLEKEIGKILRKKKKRKSRVAEIFEVIEELNKLKKGQE